MSIYVAGSLAFDRIMTFDGRFSDSILPDKLNDINVSFLVDSLVEKRGGCAGNIAYTLSLMGEKPIVLAAAGKNFGEYGAFLESLGLPLEGVRVVPGEFTAGCTVITDLDGNQINGFHPAAMSFPCLYSFPRVDARTDWAIVSPGNLEDMKGLPKTFREKGVRYVFDPGQQIPALSGEEILEAAAGAALLASNEYELEMICRKTGRTQAELLSLTGGLVTTMGSRGSLIRLGGKEERIGVAKPAAEADPTGAGDAFRSGLLKGLSNGADAFASARLGATCASYCVERRGTQEHSFGYEDFAARHRAAFGEEPVVRW